MQEAARNSGLLLWMLRRVIALTVEAGQPDLSEPFSGSAMITADTNNTNNALEKQTRTSIWKYRHHPIEGLELDVTVAEAASKEGHLDSARLLLSLLCLGDKTNEAAMFRALPESFVAFLALHPSHDITTSEDNDDVPTTSNTHNTSNTPNIPNARVSSKGQGAGSGPGKPSPPQGFLAAYSTPQLNRIFQAQSTRFHSNNVSRMDTSLDSSTSSSVHSNSAAPDSGSSTSALLSYHGAEVRVTYAAKMGVHDKGTVNFMYFVFSLSEIVPVV